jgi:hypothetical protein
MTTVTILIQNTDSIIASLTHNKKIQMNQIIKRKGSET